MIKITDTLIAGVAVKAKRSKRKRKNYNCHKAYSEKVQRRLNVAYPGTYIRPHKHENPDKVEIFIILKGRVLIVTFNDKGGVKERFLLDAKKGNRGVEIQPKVWHSLICLEEASCLYEVKEGPYEPLTDKNFAPWAPKEGTEAAALFNERILSTSAL